MARLLEQYRQTVVPELRKLTGKKNDLALARIEKIVVNIGIGKRDDAEKLFTEAIGDLAQITGQKPVETHARRSVSGFKLREGERIGLKVTMRGLRMYEFLDRLIATAIPRIRDFRGLPENSFDAAGNYNFGLTEQTVFPEINIDKVEHTIGMNVTIVIRNGSHKESLELLRGLGMPFRQVEAGGAAGG